MSSVSHCNNNKILSRETQLARFWCVPLFRLMTSDYDTEGTQNILAAEWRQKLK